MSMFLFIGGTGTGTGTGGIVYAGGLRVELPCDLQAGLQEMLCVSLVQDELHASSATIDLDVVVDTSLEIETDL